MSIMGFSSKNQHVLLYWQYVGQTGTKFKVYKQKYSFSLR